MIKGQATMTAFSHDYGEPRYLGGAEQGRLLAIMLDGQNSPAERAKAGHAINDAGSDLRPGVVDFNWGPDYWCKVEQGKFIYQEDPNAEIPYDYWMGKYLITYAQWKSFLDDEEGFRSPAWWAGLHTQGQAQQTKGADDQAWKIANHPIEHVSWYDAMAFCRWLNEKRQRKILKLPSFLPAHYEIRLPTEKEWEKASCGVDGREYPWGDGYQVGFANIDETDSDQQIGPHYINMTTAVGLYLQGASPCGALDMAGNVWEWCLTEYDTGDNKNISSAKPRVLRGGSWYLQADFARSTVRNRNAPDNRYWDFGFRVCCSAPVQ
jgi:formylglycine-generating enzyme required for sulfatase activity